LTSALISSFRADASGVSVSTGRALSGVVFAAKIAASAGKG
jgi:hypothetical protein